MKSPAAALGVDGGDVPQYSFVADNHVGAQAGNPPDCIDRLVFVNDTARIEVFATTGFGILCVADSHATQTLRAVVVGIALLDVFEDFDSVVKHRHMGLPATEAAVSRP